MHLVNVILPIFLVIFLGTLLKITRLIDGPLGLALNKLVYHIFLPILVFWEISRAPFGQSFNGWLVAAAFMAMGLLFIFTLWTGRFIGFTPAQVGSLTQGSFRGNLAYVGLALVSNIYGPAGLSKAGVLAGFMIPFMNFFSILGLVMAQNPPGLSQVTLCLPEATPCQSQETPYQKLRLSAFYRSIFLNSLVLASFLGLFFSFYSLRLPLVLSNTLGLLSHLALPLALLSMGGNLSFQGIKGGLGPAFLGTLLKLLGLPLIGLFILQFLGISGLDLKITILLLSCPTAAVTYIISSEFGGNLDLSASLVLLTTLISVLTIPFWVWFMGF